MIKFEGVEHESVSHLARAYGMRPHTLHNRLGRGHTLEDAMNFQPFQNLRIINERREWLEKMGWPTEGLCTSATWALWGKVLTKLYRDTSSTEIAAVCGTTAATILRDLRKLNIKVRPIGGANHRGPEHQRRQVNANMQELLLARKQRLPALVLARREGLPGMAEQTAHGADMRA